jgi:hypothetical protein
MADTTEDLSEEDEERVLQRLADIRGNPDELAKYNTQAWVWREVVASSRLSGIEIADVLITCEQCGRYHSIYVKCGEQ